MENNETYRGYFFGNFYLSQIQQGIQAAHVIQNMASRYNSYKSDAASHMFNSWMYKNKTMILLNGGAHFDLKNLISRLNLLTRQGTQYPVGYFEEEESALNGAVTSVGIVLPGRVYNPDMIGENFAHLSPREIDIYNIIKSYKLA